MRGSIISGDIRNPAKPRTAQTSKTKRSFSSGVF
jgi:hypothetical protein